MFKMSHLDGNICKIVYIFVFVLLLLRFTLKMVITTGNSHYQLSIVICQRGGSVACCIITGKPYTTYLNILFWKWVREQTYSLNSVSIAPNFSESFSDGFSPFLVFGGCFLRFGSFITHSITIAKTWCFIYEQA